MAEKCTATVNCTGNIEDGFCNVCGMQPAAARPSTPEPQAAVAAVAPVTTGNKCQVSNCTGIIEDGFCNVCGSSPQAAPAPIGPTGTHRSQSMQLSGQVSGKTSRGSQRSSATSISRSRRLGMGLVAVPDVPKVDPLKIIMSEAKVPEAKRFCTGVLPDGNNCDAPLAKEKCTRCGHSHDFRGTARTGCEKCGGPCQIVSREKGFCNVCGTPYDYRPKLKPGDRVAQQYEVVGCIAFGGMGWIYLALDVTLNRYVVLKGLVNSSDPNLAKAAVAERQFLAEVKHANIVSVYTSVEDTRLVDGKSETHAYTVMEFVGGRTLKSLRKERGPLPVAEVLAYMYPTLVAFGYMHGLALIYNDFKPDNVMLEDGDIKVIDLGGVCRASQTDGDIYSTIGYAAPELATDGPSVVSDLYSIARTIAVLTTEFAGFQSGTYRHKLRSQAEEPVYQRYESFYRFLEKACHAEPNMRFQTADEMAEQLLGVMREVVAIDTGVPRPAESRLFTGDTLATRSLENCTVDTLDIDSLPALKMETADPGAVFILSNLASGDPRKQTPVIQQALDQFPDSIEALLSMARNQIRLGNYADAEELLKRVEKLDGFEWRVLWYRGLSLLANRMYTEAATAFETCYNEVPGELGVKLALAAAYELSGNVELAVTYYKAVSSTDVNFTTAIFGLGRLEVRRGKRQEAVDALLRVPQTSSLYGEAQKAVARTLIRSVPEAPSLSELEQAAKTVEALMLEGVERFSIARDIFDTALNLLTEGKLTPTTSVSLLGHGVDDRQVRLGLEAAYRGLALLANDDDEMIRLVDMANAVRPRTLF